MTGNVISKFELSLFLSNSLLVMDVTGDCDQIAKLLTFFANILYLSKSNNQIRYLMIKISRQIHVTSVMTDTNTHTHNHTHANKCICMYIYICFLYQCEVLRCAQIVGYIMARWSHLFVCIIHYLIIIIMQTYDISERIELLKCL